MKRNLLLLVAVLTAAALVFPTVAIPSVDGGDELPNDVVIAPADSPNSAYAELHGGDIALALDEANQRLAADGVIEDSLTEIDAVLTIAYTGNDSVDVWIDARAADGTAIEDVSFYSGDDPDDPLEGAANAKRLGPNETLDVGLLVDTRGESHDVESIDEFAVGTDRHDDDSSDGGLETPDDEPSEETQSGTAAPATEPATTPASEPTATPVPEQTATPTPEQGTETSSQDDTPDDTGTVVTDTATPQRNETDQSDGVVGSGPTLDDSDQTLVGALSETILWLSLAVTGGMLLFLLARRSTDSEE